MLQNIEADLVTKMGETDRSYSKPTLEFTGASFVIPTDPAKSMDRL